MVDRNCLGTEIDPRSITMSVLYSNCIYIYVSERYIVVLVCRKPHHHRIKNLLGKLTYVLRFFPCSSWCHYYVILNWNDRFLHQGWNGKENDKYAYVDPELWNRLDKNVSNSNVFPDSCLLRHTAVQGQRDCLQQHKHRDGGERALRRRAGLRSF